ncbi:MAG: Arylsulfatase [candidate division BRC1 bacterium ADurb.BinA364]|nr:MAG: Arylsulfatase [candidate division BRC1 bacterium ADurb.BinA364]
MDRRHFLKAAGAGAAALLTSRFAAAAETAQRPNILWLTIEDSSAYLFGFNGNPYVKTPNLDALAAKGIVFENAISNAPYCSPARSSIISGCYAPTYCTDQHRGGKRVPEAMYFFPRFLRQAGYFTTNNAKTDYNVAGDQMKRNMPEVWSENSGKATYNSAAREPGQPFFSVFNHMGTHMSRLTTVVTKGREPYRIDPAGLSLPPHVPDLPEMREDYALHLEGVEDIDKWVGLHLETLREKGLEEDTIVFFYSDHGGCLPRGKAFPFDTGYRVPMIVYVPEKWRSLSPWTPGERSDRLVEFVDLGPTALALAGVDIPEWMHGKPFMGAAELAPKPFSHAFRCNSGPHYDPSRSTFDGRYHYIRYYTPYKPHGLRQFFQWQMPSQLAWDWQNVQGQCKPEHRDYYLPKPTEMLFDLQADPWELNNLADDPAHRDTLQRLRAETSEWMRRIQDLGFFPASLRSKDPKKSQYEWVRETQYPVEELIEAAETAGLGDPACEEKLKAYMASDKPEFRFWGVAGIALLAQRGLLKGLPGGLEKAMRDETPEVAVTAAEALCYLGRQEKGLPYLLQEAKSGNSLAFSALEELGPLASEGVPALREMAESGKSKGVRQNARSVLITQGQMPMDQLFEQSDIDSGMAGYRQKLNWRVALP